MYIKRRWRCRVEVCIEFCVSEVGKLVNSLRVKCAVCSGSLCLFVCVTVCYIVVKMFIDILLGSICSRCLPLNNEKYFPRALTQDCIFNDQEMDWYSMFVFGFTAGGIATKFFNKVFFSLFTLQFATKI